MMISACLAGQAGMMNDEVKKSKINIRCSIFDIQIAKKIGISPRKTEVLIWPR
jgi:hypothetical protein